ncbi:MAG: hypothetical protein P8Q37_10140 [Porticoccaceae bacterium]|nr:hypothetical protein [Porticoccaceae bacterium]MDG1475255.1 hypothetical protein [Porticoccaceae bacterium]
MVCSNAHLDKSVSLLLYDQQVIDCIFAQIDNGTTDLGDTVGQELADNYHSQERFDTEIPLLRSKPVPFCPSAGLPETGSCIARKAAGNTINSCLWRGWQGASLYQFVVTLACR